MEESPKMYSREEMIELCKQAWDKSDTTLCFDDFIKFYLN